MNDTQYKLLMDAQAAAKRLEGERELRIEAMHVGKAIDNLLNKYAERKVIEELAAPF